jgi:hypothetical protein
VFFLLKIHCPSAVARVTYTDAIEKAHERISRLLLIVEVIILGISSVVMLRDGFMVKFGRANVT